MALSVAASEQVIGLVPAAGAATRMGVLPCSKEVLPIGFARFGDADREVRPTVACEPLLEAFRQAGIATAYVILRPGKWDIPAYLGDGRRHGIDLAYLTVGVSHGVPFTLDQARPFVRGHRIALGFPDILFEPKDALARLDRRQRETGADVVLGLFPADEPQRMDMVASGVDGRVHRVLVKPATTTLSESWILALWTDRFSEFMHGRLLAWLQRPGTADGRSRAGGSSPELHLGHVFAAALDAGLHVDSLRFPRGSCVDIGTVASLQRVQREWGRLEEQ